ncbi:MAG: T9SS type A sorting domain-containing protein [Bacteroidia bacterium]
MKNLLFFLCFCLLMAEVSLAQNTYYSIQSGDWSNPGIWAASPNGNGPAGPPTASDHVVIRDSVWHYPPANYIHTGNITVVKYARYFINTLSGSAFVFGGSLFDIFGKVITSGDLANQIPGSSGSGLIVINPWANLHAGKDIVLNALGSMIIDNPNCGAVQTCVDIIFNGDGAGVCGSGSMIVPGQVKVYDNNGALVTPYPAALIAAANLVCQNFPFYAGKNDCSLQLPILTGTNNSFPVELISFQAIPSHSGVDIVWETASELNNDFFTIERAEGESEFVAVGTVSGAGNSDEVRDYLFEDHTLTTGTWRYRLRQTDYDGKFTFSNTEQVTFQSREGMLSIYPNPASSGPVTLTLTDKESMPVRIEVRDVLGRICYETPSTTDHSGTLIFPMALNQPSGRYFVSVITPVKKYSAVLLMR